MHVNKIGVFDSGVGGLSVANAIKKELSQYEVVFMNDAEHVPYGTKGLDEIYSFTKPIIQKLIEEGCQIIVIACNTVTTNLISKLRSEFSVPFVGIEPMVKPASLNTSTGVIAVCATPRTLESSRYKTLKDEYAKNIRVLEPDCSDWALMIESNNIDQVKIKTLVEGVIAEGADQIVLGCTHYHWIAEIIDEIADGKASVIHPEAAVISRLKTVIEQLP